MVVVAGSEAPHYDELDPLYYEGFENLNAHNLISFKSFHEVFNTTAEEEGELRKIFKPGTVYEIVTPSLAPDGNDAEAAAQLQKILKERQPV